MLTGLVYNFLPFFVLPMYATLERLDPALLEAAADLGARPFATLRRVIIPLSAPGIVAGSVLVFIPCLGAYLTPDLLGGGKIRDAGQSGAEPVHHRARLAVRLGGFAGPDARQRPPAGPADAQPRGAGADVKQRALWQSTRPSRWRFSMRRC